MATSTPTVGDPGAVGGGSRCGQRRLHDPPTVGTRPGEQSATEQRDTLTHADETEPRRRRRCHHPSPVVTDGQPHPVDVVHDLDVHAGGVAGVASGVGEGFLGDPVERHADRRWWFTPGPRQVHLDGRRPGGAGQPFEVRQAGLGGEVRLATHAQDTDDGAHLRQRPRRGVLDRPEHRHRTIGMGARHGSSRLGLDDDARHVVTDGVVQVAGEVVTLSQLGLLDLTHAGGGVETDGGPEGGGEQEEPVAGHDLPHRARIRDVGDAQPHQDDRESDDGLTARTPSQQRVRQHERDRDARQHGRVTRHDPCHVEDDQRAERDRDRSQRMGPPPQHAQGDHAADDEGGQQPGPVRP